MDGVLIIPAVLLALGYVALGVLSGALYLRSRHLDGLSRSGGAAGHSLGPLPIGDDDEELVAVLTAAAEAAIGRPVRVHRVHVHPRRAMELWSRAGRMDIMISHRVEPKR